MAVLWLTPTPYSFTGHDLADTFDVVRLGEHPLPKLFDDFLARAISADNKAVTPAFATVTGHVPPDVYVKLAVLHVHHGSQHSVVLFRGRIHVILQVLGCEMVNSIV